MHRAAQHLYVTAGIAIVGAGLIALPAAAALMASGPNVVVADVLLTSTDQDAAVDAVAALAGINPDVLTTPELNIAISIDGFPLLQEGSATAFSDSGNFAMAIGADSDATATGGFLESAIAVGSNDTADAYGGDLNTAVATGTGADATATTGNFESAIANSGLADAYGGNGNYAFATDGGDATATHGNFLSAFASGNNALADSYNGTGEMTSATGSGSDAFAENGSFDTAIVNGAGGMAESQWGTGDEAIAFGDSSVTAGGNSADLGNYDIAAAFGNLDHVLSGAGPLDTVGSFDLASVFGDGLSSSGATGANWLVEILPSL